MSCKFASCRCIPRTVSSAARSVLLISTISGVLIVPGSERSFRYHASRLSDSHVLGPKLQLVNWSALCKIATSTRTFSTDSFYKRAGNNERVAQHSPHRPGFENTCCLKPYTPSCERSVASSSCIRRAPTSIRGSGAWPRSIAQYTTVVAAPLLVHSLSISDTSYYV